MWPLDPLPQPPIPQRLREMLKNYPELIQVLQENLNSVLTEPVKGTPPFEVALWRLKDALEGFVFQARDELDAARARGDLPAAEQADRKERLMSHAHSSGGGLKNLRELREYFETNQGVFR
jgi:hypothetical protein